MKRVLTLLALAMFLGGGIAGCEASGRVGDTDNGHGGSYTKKTTTVQEPYGDHTTKTEVRTTHTED